MSGGTDPFPLQFYDRAMRMLMQRRSTKGRPEVPCNVPFLALQHTRRSTEGQPEEEKQPCNVHRFPCTFRTLAPTLPLPYCPVPDHNCQPRSPSTPRRPGGPMPSGARQSPRGRCRGCRRSCECAGWILRETGGSCSSDSSQRSDPQVSGAGTYCSSRHVAANFGCLPRSCLPLFPTVSRSLLPSPISKHV